MSLKAFHIFFILLASVLAEGLGVWAIGRWRAIGVASLTLGVLLLFYLVWFWRTMKKVSSY